MTQVRSDVAVRTFNINRPDTRGIDFDSQLMHQYGVHSLPSFIIASPDGEVISDGPPAFEQVLQQLQGLGLLQN